MTKLDLATIAHLTTVRGQIWHAKEDPTPENEIRKRLIQHTVERFDNMFADATFKPDEFIVTTRTGPDDATTYAAHWRPPAAGYTDAELHGGPCDGTVIVGGCEHGTTFVAKYEKPIGEHEFETDPTVPAVRYELDGWNTKTQQWIYRAQP